MRWTSLQLGALLAAGAWAVHELRYRVAFGDAAQDVMVAHGHGYLSALVPLIGLALAFACGQFVAQWARADSPEALDGRSGTARWAGLAAALSAVYGMQELLEGALVAGHPGGVAAVVGAGGWIAFGAALVVGGAVTLILGGADAVLTRRHRGACGRLVPRTVSPARRASAPRCARAALIGRHLAGRAPPVGLRI